MIIDFEKTIHFHAEVDDKRFQNEFGNITEDVIINYCESIESPTDDETCWIYSDELKNITWKKSENEKEHKITESEYNHYREERERAERCYECSGYGDDYSFDENGEMTSNCDGCPFNEYEDDYADEGEEISPQKSINPQEFIQELCDKLMCIYMHIFSHDESITNIKYLFERTKFSYMIINPSNRIFLFAENPMEFMENNSLWNLLQEWVNEEYDTFIAIGKCISNVSNEENIISISNISDYLR